MALGGARRRSKKTIGMLAMDKGCGTWRKYWKTKVITLRTSPTVSLSWNMPAYGKASLTGRHSKCELEEQLVRRTSRAGALVLLLAKLGVWIMALAMEGAGSRVRSLLRRVGRKRPAGGQTVRNTVRRVDRRLNRRAWEAG